jgi:hypothetical protein
MTNHSTHSSPDSSPEPLPWQQAVKLMQPAFIRVIDHLRTTLEQSDWVGKYETLQAWPSDATPEIQAEVLYLMDQIEAVEEGDRAELEQQLEGLPQPISVYLLHLTKAGQARTLNLWEMCYQICLASYTPQLERPTFIDIPLEEILPDYTLLDEDGEVDWPRLDLKTAHVVQSAFESLECMES